MRRTWLVGSLLGLFAVNAPAASPVDGLNDNPSVRLLFALDPFEEPIGYSVLEGNAKEKVLGRFGVPLEEIAATVPTRFPGETYTSYFIRFEDVAFTIGKWPDRAHSWIETIEIDGDAHGLKSGIRIGSTRDDVFAVFSPPANYAQANPVQVSTSIFETPADVGEDGLTVDSDGAFYQITFEFGTNDRVSKLLITMSAD